MVEDASRGCRDGFAGLSLMKSGFRMFPFNSIYLTEGNGAQAAIYMHHQTVRIHHRHVLQLVPD